MHAVIFEAYLQFLIRESKMSYLSQQNSGSTVVAENTDVFVDWIFGNKARVRKNKILEIRQQIDEDTYDIDKRLNTVCDRLLEDLVG
jgi:hypothetical protein